MKTKIHIEILRTNNFWIDNGMVILGRWLWLLGSAVGLKRKEIKLDPNKLLIKNITEEKFKEILNHEVKEKYFKEIKGAKKRFKSFLTPFIRQYTTGPPWVDEIFPTKMNTTCFFCNNATSDEEKHLRVNRAVFPIYNAKFPAFNPLFQREPPNYVCPMCYILGRLAAFNSFFSRRGITYFYFIPYSYDLTTLSEIEPLLERAEENSNYTNPLAKYHTDKFYEEMLSAFYYCYLKLLGLDKEDVFQKLNSFYCFLYDGMLVTDFVVFNETERLYNLFSKLEAEALPSIFNYFFTEENEYLRNQFCKHLLKFTHIIQDIVEILYIKLKNDMYYPFPKNLDTFIQIYYCEVMKMSEEEKNMFKDVGWGIGVFASGSYEGGKDQKNILYNLRNSDTLQKFVNVLNSVMINEFSITKHETIEKLLGTLDKRNWGLIKEFVLAYALNKYLSIKSAKKLGGEEK